MIECAGELWKNGGGRGMRPLGDDIYVCIQSGRMEQKGCMTRMNEDSDALRHCFVKILPNYDKAMITTFTTLELT